MKNSKKMMIKAKTSNAIHKIIDPNPVKPKHVWLSRAHIRLQEIQAMSDADKLKMFEAILDAHRSGSFELAACSQKLRTKKRVQKLRDAKIASGEKPAKKRTSKAEWEAMNAQKANI